MPVATNEPEYLTLPEAAERFGVAVRTLRSWRAKRLITRYARKDGTAIVEASDVAQYLATRQEIINQDEASDDDGDQAAE